MDLFRRALLHCGVATAFVLSTSAWAQSGGEAAKRIPRRSLKDVGTPPSLSAPASAATSSAPADSQSVVAPAVVKGLTPSPAKPQGLGTAVPVNSQELGTAVPVTPAQPPLAQPPQGPATAQPVGSGPVVVVPVQPGGTVVVQPPSQGGGAGPVVVTPVQPVQRNPGTHRRYQLVAREFVVLRQTVDDSLERDGAGDEIQIRLTTLNVDRDGNFLSDTSIRSGSFGAPDHNDFAAGTAEAGWSAEQRIGGLKTGDVYPPRPREIQHNGDLPMVLWEGTLEMGGPSVVLVPTIWELDGTAGQAANRRWGESLVYVARNNRARISDVLSTLGEPGASFVTDDLFPEVSISITGERPIATAPQLPMVTILDILLPVIVQRPEILNPKIIMKVPAIALNFARAEDLSSRPASTINVGSHGGVLNIRRELPVGAFPVRYTDPDGMDGDYLLILQLVRMPD